MTLDSAIRKYVDRALRAVGTPWTIRRVTPGTYNTTTGTQTPSVEDTTALGRADPYTERELAASTSIKATDLRLIITASDLAFEPVIHDEAVHVPTELVYDVVNVTHLRAQHQAAAYELQLRR